MQKTIGRSALLCGLAAATVGAVFAAHDVWSSGFWPDFPAHAQTTADNLPFFAGVGALLFGVPGAVVGFVVGLAIAAMARRRRTEKPPA